MTTFCLLSNFNLLIRLQHIPLDKAELKVAKLAILSLHEQLKFSKVRILRLVLTFGATSATCKGTFSTLTRILTPYRRSMLHQRKADLVLLAFEHDLTEKLLSETTTDKVMRKFCGCGSGRRLPLC